MPRIAANAGCPQTATTCQAPCVPTSCAPMPANVQSCPPCQTELTCCFTDLAGFDSLCHAVSLSSKSEITFYNLAAANTIKVQRLHINAGGVKRFADAGLPLVTSGQPTLMLGKGSYYLCISAIDPDTKFSVEPI